MRKPCATCNKPFTPTAKVGRHFSYCPACRTVRRKEDWVKSRDRIAAQNRASHIRKYGITVNEYNQILEAQNHACAICGSKNGGFKKIRSFAIDHDHLTGKVRGLLCQPCNTGLGLFRDSTEIIGKAMSYLSKENVDTKARL